MIAPGLKVSFGALGEEHAPRAFKGEACLIEAGRRAGRAFPWMAARIEAAAPGPRIGVGWIAGADRNRSNAHVTETDVPAFPAGVF
jgi:hypothetical protein